MPSCLLVSCCASSHLNGCLRTAASSETLREANCAGTSFAHIAVADMTHALLQSCPSVPETCFRKQHLCYSASRYRQRSRLGARLSSKGHDHVQSSAQQPEASHDESSETACRPPRRVHRRGLLAVAASVAVGCTQRYPCAAINLGITMTELGQPVMLPELAYDKRKVHGRHSRRT